MQHPYPLNIFIVWHPSFSQGQALASALYSAFCREYEKPLSRGLGIPVYFRHVKLEDNKPLKIDFSQAKKNAVVLLIDDNLFLDDDFRDYLEELSLHTNENNRAFPVALSAKAHAIGCNLEKLQFINGLKFQDAELELSKEEDLKLSVKKISTEILHECCRLMLEFQPTSDDRDSDRAGSPVKLFLSHAKIDGEKLSIRFKEFIERNLKLDVFFDTVDIPYGYDFSKHFESEVRNSALVVFHTDMYSSREWCRREVLIAKKYKSPIVVVHDIKDGERRAFPYLGNMPTTTISGEEEYISFYKIVSLTLLQVLNNLYQLSLLETFKVFKKDDSREVYVLSSPPELFNFLDINQKRKNTTKDIVILYPDPPLGIEELNVLNELEDDILFVTPINFL